MLSNRTAQLPPDRGHVTTEQRHPAAQRLDETDIDQCAALMIDDHRIVIEAANAARPALVAFLTALVPRMRAGGRLMYLGAGTSGRLGVLDASECPSTFQSDPGQIVGIIAGGDAALRRSSESMEDDFHGAAAALGELDLNASDTVLGIAAGGTTPYVLGGLRIGRAGGAMTGLLTCAPPAPRPEDCDHLMILETGPEILTGSTRLKAGSATKLALNIITTTLFVQLGKVYSNLMVDLRATNNKLTDRAIRVLVELCPELDRHAAMNLLHAADGQLKIAIVMQRRGVDAATAIRFLAQSDGWLRRALAGERAGPVS
jgi:N-acetylmuramic acid 6-phosphate etherase